MDIEPNNDQSTPVNFGAIGSGAIIPGASFGFPAQATSISHSVSSFDPSSSDPRDIFAFNHSANTERLTSVSVELSIAHQADLMDTPGVSGILTSYTITPLSNLQGPPLDVTVTIGSFSYLSEIMQLITLSSSAEDAIHDKYMEKLVNGIVDNNLYSDWILAKNVTTSFNRILEFDKSNTNSDEISAEINSLLFSTPIRTDIANQYFRPVLDLYLSLLDGWDTPRITYSLGGVSFEAFAGVTNFNVVWATTPGSILSMFELTGGILLYDGANIGYAPALVDSISVRHNTSLILNLVNLGAGFGTVEPTSDQREIIFSVSLRDAAAVPVSVDYVIEPYGAAPASSDDFAAGFAMTGRVVFAPGQVTQFITLPIKADTLVEDTEQFVVRLLNPQAPDGGLAIGATSAVIGSIVDYVTPSPSIGTSDADDIQGTNSVDVIFSEAGNDTIRPAGGDDYVDGGEGSDEVVYASIRSASAVELETFGTIKVVGPDIGTDTLTSIERIRFSDGSLIFDLAGSDAALIYRLYQAAFARTPDEGGLRYWSEAADLYDLSQIQLATEFRTAPEFIEKYGASVSNRIYTYNMYKNVLGREPDQGGIDYWTNVVDIGWVTRDQLLIEFAQSPENILLTAANTTSGYWVV